MKNLCHKCFVFWLRKFVFDFYMGTPHILFLYQQSGCMCWMFLVLTLMRSLLRSRETSAKQLNLQKVPCNFLSAQLSTVFSLTESLTFLALLFPSLHSDGNDIKHGHPRHLLTGLSCPFFFLNEEHDGHCTLCCPEPSLYAVLIREFSIVMIRFLQEHNDIMPIGKSCQHC